jgi:endonuclease/exonuclease/phosphatase family metal-dependent hydrolase
MRLKILQWNVWTKENVSNIASEIKKIAPDIVCAQELVTFSKKGVNTAKSIASLTDYDYFYKEAETWDVKGKNESQGNALFSRLPILNTFYYYVQEPKHNPPDAYHEGRIYVEIEVEAGDSLLTVGTTHLSYSAYFKLDKERKKEINNLVSLIKEKDKNYVFTGDLNSLPSDLAVKKIAKHLKHAGPDFNKKTWTTKPFEYRDGFKEDKLNWRIDYVFASRDVKVLQSEIVKTKYSDHLPVLVEVDI